MEQQDEQKDEQNAAFSRLRRNINATALDYSRLNNILAQINGAIAGSYVMQAILDEHWPGSDIDIWAVEQPYGSIMSPVVPLWAYLVHGHGYNCTQYSPSAHLLDDEYARLTDSITKVYTFKHPSNNTTLYPTVQLMGLRQLRYDHGLDVRTPNTVERTLTEFDIEACRVYYTPTGSVQGVQDAILKCIEQTLTISPEALGIQTIFEWLRTLKRIKKYVLREFVFEWTGELSIILMRKFEDMFFPGENRDQRQVIEEREEERRRREQWDIVQEGQEIMHEDVKFGNKWNDIIDDGDRNANQPLVDVVPFIVYDEILGRYVFTWQSRWI